VACPLGCGETIQWLDIEAHQLSCERRFESCSICNAKVRVGGMDAHRIEAALEHAQILEKRLANTVDVAGRLARIELNMQFLARGSQIGQIIREHQLMKAELKALQSSHRDSVIWTFWNAKVLLDSHPCDSYVTSETFSLKGAGGFVLVYYPNGESTSPPSKSSLWVKGPDNPQWTIALNVDDGVAVHFSNADQDQKEDGFAGRRDHWPKPALSWKGVSVTVKVLKLTTVIDCASEEEDDDE
jgi:hypothetical protein